MSKHIQYGKNLAFCLHIQDERQGYVLCYSLYENDELRIFVNHGQEQFHLSSLDIENKKSIVYTDEEINQISHFAINLIAYISGWSLISIRIRKDRLSFVHETVVNAQANIQWSRADAQNKNHRNPKSRL